MQPDARDAAYLLDMLDSSRLVLQYVTSRTRKDLDRNSMLFDAIQRRIEIIGEAARRVSKEFKDAHPEIQWRPIMATRHILAHDYDEVNPDIVWQICQQHLPRLNEQIGAILPSL